MPRTPCLDERNSRCSTQYRRRALSICSVHLFWFLTTYSQRLFTSFGPCAELSLGYTPSCLAVGIGTGLHSREIVVTESDHPRMHFYTVSREGSIAEIRSLETSTQAVSIDLDDLNADKLPEYVSLASDYLSISVLHHSLGTWNERPYRLKTPGQGFLIADINNDKRKDILLFGRKSAGIRTLLGRPDGEYITGPLLFPDISVSDVKATDLNGDGITDLVLLNWLSNQLIIFYGIGRGVFSEQITYELPGEPENLAIAGLLPPRSLDIAVTLPEDQSILVLNSTPMGDLKPIQTLHCPGSPRGVTYSLINDDPYPDLVTWTDELVLVALGISMSDVGQATAFGPSTAVGKCIVADVDGDRKNDLVILNPSQRSLIVVGNADGAGFTRTPLEYAVGARPLGLAVGDFNNDGLSDIAVANSRSLSVSILFNKGHGKFDGQQAIQLADTPTSLQCASSLPGHQPTLVASHPGANKFSVLPLDEEISHSSTFTVPTCTDPFALRAGENPATGRMEILVRCTDHRDQSRSLSLFEQLSGSQFLEHSVSLNLPYSITALAVVDFRNSGTEDLIFATHDSHSAKSTISIAPATGNFLFKSTRPLFSFQDSTFSLRAIQSGFIDSDTFRDVIVILGQPENKLGIAYGRADGTCRDSVSWIRGVRVLSEETMVVGDVDANGTTDITYVDPVEREVVTMFGRGNGRFAAPTPICRADGIKAIKVVSLRQANVQDLILSDEKKGVVTIMYDPFRK